HYTLLPLTLGHIRHFAERWYQHYSLEGTERTAQGLVQRIVESPRLLDLAGNPLLLTMMAVIYKDRDLPNERWRLYDRCADTLLEDWGSQQRVPRLGFQARGGHPHRPEVRDPAAGRDVHAGAPAGAPTTDR